MAYIPAPRGTVLRHGDKRYILVQHMIPRHNGHVTPVLLAVSEGILKLIITDSIGIPTKPGERSFYVRKLNYVSP